MFDVLERLITLAPRADIELHRVIDTDVWEGTKVARRLQSAGDLGARMLHALSTALGEGRPQAVVIGADVPILPVSHLEAVRDSQADVALVPTDDGGYCVIGCRRTYQEMFKSVRWSHPSTCEDTPLAERKCSLNPAISPGWFDGRLSGRRCAIGIRFHPAAAYRRVAREEPHHRHGD